MASESQKVGWRYVSKKFPCAVCGKPDWCAVGEKYICCMRVLSNKTARNGGYLHLIDGVKPASLPPTTKREAPTINATKFFEEWGDCGTESALPGLADLLGVTVESLGALGSTYIWDLSQVNKHWRGTAWAFPMCDAWRNYVGVRLRQEKDEGADKWAVTGSHQGLFLPRMEPKARVFICEGPTDTAAGLSMGLFTIGRPSCRGCEGTIIQYLKRQDVREAVLIGDNDGAGTEGALLLAAMLPIPSVILTPPAKDLRRFYRAGGTAGILNALADSRLWTQPRK